MSGSHFIEPFLFLKWVCCGVKKIPFYRNKRREKNTKRSENIRIHIIISGLYFCAVPGALFRKFLTERTLSASFLDKYFSFYSNEKKRFETSIPNPFELF